MRPFATPGAAGPPGSRLVAPRYAGDRLRAAVLGILDANALCTMATRSAAGVVDINTAFYSFSEELELYFLSNPASAHCRNLAHTGQMAVAVCDSHQEWGATRAGLQLYGTGGPVPAGHCERARASYAARFPRYFDLVLRAGEDADAATALDALRLYRFVPARIKILDEHEFGEEVYVMAAVVA